MTLLGRLRNRLGRPPKAPTRETDVYPRLMQIGQIRQGQRPAYKPTPRNLRYFSRTPYARRAINAIKNSIAQLDWEVVARPGMQMSPELERQIEATYVSLQRPNQDDNWSSLMEMVTEDMMLGAGAIEMGIGADLERPLWLWPVDGLSIQVFPFWDENSDSARYAQVLGYGSPVGAETAVQLRNDELIYLKPNPCTADPFGVGPLEIAFSTVSRLLGVAEFAGLVSSNANPSVAMWMGNIDATTISAFRTYWKNDIEGQGRMPIFGGGDKEPQALLLRPEGDAGLFLKYQEMLKSEIATAFDISPQNLGLERDINRNTAEVAEDRDVAQAIGPWARKIAGQISREAIQGRLGFSQIEMRFKGIDREDEKVQAEVYKNEYQNNAITPNEYRARRGMPLSNSPWADLHYADVQIAVMAARGSAQISDVEGPEFDKNPSDDSPNKSGVKQKPLKTSEPTRPSDRRTKPGGK